MRVMRASLYKNPYSARGQNPNDPTAPVNQPMTIVARDVDLMITPDDSLMGAKLGAAQNGGFCTGEVFEVTGVGHTIKHVTILAERKRQRRAQIEVNQSMLYYWDAMYLTRANPGGVISGTMPIPLKASEVEEVLRLLAEHPDYDHQTVIAIAENGQMVKMKDGVIS